MTRRKKSINRHGSFGRVMEVVGGGKISVLTPEELLGPLNDVEQKFAPKKLYVAGAIGHPLPTPRVSIVGSRKASPHGLKVARELARTFVRNGITIVSGLAEGIDTAAHTAAIEEGGRTIAVLGTPLSQVYPRQNAWLQEAIMRDHLAISQFAPERPVMKQNFVIRNRTMALISNSTIIVEAKDDSGSLHQGWEALRLGRPLFIWKAVLDDASMIVARRMLDYGAMRLTKADEVLPQLPSTDRILEIVQ